MTGIELLVVGGILLGTYIIRKGIQKFVNCTRSPSETLQNSRNEFSKMNITIGEVIKCNKGYYKDCIICFEPILKGEYIRILDCKHEFHTECIDQWIHIAANCPICRNGI